MKSLFPTMLLLLTTLFLGAQIQPETAALAPETYAVVATGRVLDGGVELRWYPGSAGIWRFANEKGYHLERMELGPEGERQGWQLLGGQPIRPYREKEWSERTDMRNDYVRAAARAILEPPAPPARDAGFEAWKAWSDQENGIFLFFTLATNLHPDAAFGAGLRYLDTSIVPGKAYAYRIAVPDWKGQTDHPQAMVIIEDTRQRYLAPAVTGVRVEELDGAVRVFWPSDPNEVLFPTFHVERSADGITWQRLNRLPVFFGSDGQKDLFFTDSVANYRPHWYRVTGITPFADAGQPSEPIRAMARDLTPPVGAIRIRAEGDRRRVDVQWDLPAASPDLKGFVIGRSGDGNGPFRLLNEKPLPLNARRFSDEKPGVFEPWYIVYAVDTAGNYGPAFAALAVISDKEAPAPPRGLQGRCDTLGVVTLQWEANPEEDLAGYQVLAANRKEDVYRPLTDRPVMLTTWRDTVDMRALNRSLYYKIVAVDYHNNPSGYSDVVEVKRPDRIPPAAPSIYRYEVLEGEVLLHWHTSPSDDVVRHELLRETLPGGKTETILAFGTERQREFTDRTVLPGTAYRYTLLARDEAGHESRSTPLELSVFDPGRRPGVSELQAIYDEEKSAVVLNWRYLGNAEDHRFLLFRGLEDADLQSYRSLPAGTTRFEDDQRKGGRHRYALKVIFPSGAESPLSAIVQAP